MNKFKVGDTLLCTKTFEGLYSSVIEGEHYIIRKIESGNIYLEGQKGCWSDLGKFTIVSKEQEIILW